MRISDWSSDVCSSDLWFVKMDTLAARGLELVEGVDGKPGSVRFVPPNWINTYRHWMGNIQDWCISRQLWWGHRIPAWYDAQGAIYVGHDEAEVRSKHGLGSDVTLTRDNDVLETWFSSALRSEEHTSELQSLMRISYAVFCLQKKNNTKRQ